MRRISFTALLALGAAATAWPFRRSFRRANPTSTVDIIKIDSTTSSCDNAPAAGECRTAAQAAPYIAISFTKFGVTSFGEQAALVALMLYESGGFKYSRNHFPGIPGQGTRNMQSPAYNAQYAHFLATVCTDCGISAADVARASAQGPAAVLDLLNSDEWSFGSAAWVLRTQCAADVRLGLAAQTQAGGVRFCSVWGRRRMGIGMPCGRLPWGWEVGRLVSREL